MNNSVTACVDVSLAVNLIVMEAYGHFMLRQFFIGSHTSEMMQKTQQPLLILR